MSEQENVRTVEKLYENLNAHQLGASSDLYDPDYQSENPGAPGPMGAEQLIAYTQNFINAFPDLHFTLRHTIAQGDYVAVTWTATGTHTGPLRSPSGNTIPPTGKSGVVPGSTIYEFKNGKVTASWTYWDMVVMLNQLGLMPSM